MSSVEVWVYDISNGMAEQLLRTGFGLDIKGIWHTSIVVFGKEHYFFSGIKKSTPGSTHFGKPVEKLPYSTTTMTEKELDEFLQENDKRYTDKTYDIFENNCNHFSNAVLQFLVQKEVPAHIMELSQILKNTPFGDVIREMVGRPDDSDDL